MKNKFGVCFVASYFPRQCGIATFTQSIIDGLAEDDSVISKVVAINDPDASHRYDARVIAQIEESDSATYRKAAEAVNNDPDIDVVSLQHVFSLFGGKNGEYIIEFLEHLKKPVFTTFHMVYSPFHKPNKHEVVDKNYIDLTHRIYSLSEKVIVIIQPMKDILVNEYGLDGDKIIVMPHGSPIKRYSPKTIEKLKQKYNMNDKQIISTFGLIRPKKGLENVIYAMPEVIKKHPNTVFIIVGTNHPNRPNEYYAFLISETKRLGLESHVVFKNQFVTPEEIFEYLAITDAFVTPYVVPEQTSSGVMAYAMGCGKAIISTPFVYAKEVLSDKRGLFVNYNDPHSIFLAIDFLLSHPRHRRRMERLAFKYATKNSWHKITEEYKSLFMSSIRN